MNGIFKNTITLFFLLFTGISGYAQTCCSGGVPMSGNLGMPASNKGAFQLSLNYDVNVLKTLMFQREVIDDRDRLRKTHSILFESDYAISDNLSVDVFMSYVRQERTIYGYNGATDFTYSQGMGDAVLLVKYKIDLGNFGWAVFGAGPKIPTGSSDKKNLQGITLSADLQPGSGAWDFISWMNITHQLAFRPSTSLILTSTYRRTGVNEDYLGSIAYEFGNEFQALLSIADRINLGKGVFDPSLSLRYRFIGEDINNVQHVPNSGGQWLFLVPGISWALSNNLSLNATAEMPVFSKVEGTQLSPTYRVNTGVFYTINKKESVISIN